MGRPGAGTVSKKGRDGRWRGRVMVDGKVFSVSSRVSARDCRTKLNALIGGFVTRPPERTPVAPAIQGTGAYLEDWVAAKRVTARSPSTSAGYARVIARHLIPAFGAMPLDAVKPGHVRAMHATMAAAGFAPTTIGLAHAVLRAALNDALRDGLPVDPAVTRVRGPTPRRVERRDPTPAELGAVVIAACNDPEYGEAVALACLTGLRIGELLGLEWADVDLDAGTLRVERQLGHEDRVLRDLKTASSRRLIHLGATAAGLLRVRAVRAGARGRGMATDLVFPGPDGGPAMHETVRRAFKKILAAAGVPDVRFHALRHGHARALRAAGVDLRSIKDRLGHADVGTTSRAYLGVDTALDAEAAARLERLIAPEEGDP